MADLNAARRWAEALIELAVEARNEDAVQRDLVEVVEAVTGEGGALLKALASPVYDVEERKAVLGSVLGRIGVQPLSSNFLRLLVDRGRIGLLPEIAQVYREHIDERAGRLRVQVTTVDPLSPELERELQAAFAKATGKSVVLDTRLDKSLIGGLVARIGGRVYDASLRTRLEDIRSRLVHAQALPEA
jgi:F-type H+-transporting ATPase subunit delta